MAGPDGSGRGGAGGRREAESGGRKRRGGPSGTASERGGDRAMGASDAALEGGRGRDEMRARVRRGLGGLDCGWA